MPTKKFLNPLARGRNRYERFEFQKLPDGKWYILIPAKYLQKIGTPFDVKGKFTDSQMIIDQYRSMLSLDEEGLAHHLVDKMMDKRDLTYAVFRRLKSEHNIDSDDVAREYVKYAVRKKQAGRIKQINGLVKLLVEIMDSGWVSKADEACIEILRKL